MERGRKRERERCKIFLKGMMGALAPFRYLVQNNKLECSSDATLHNLVQYLLALQEPTQVEPFTEYLSIITLTIMEANLGKHISLFSGKSKVSLTRLMPRILL